MAQVIIYVLTLFDEREDLASDPELFAQPRDAQERALELFAYPNDSADFEGGPLWAIFTDWDTQEELVVEYGQITVKIKPTEVR